MAIRLKSEQYITGFCSVTAGWVLSTVAAVAAPTEINIEGLLQQAESACMQGDSTRLDNLSQQIRTLAQQPALQPQQAFLNQLLGLFQAGVCQPGKKSAVSNRRSPPVAANSDAAQPLTISATTKTSHVQVSAGYLDNVNQGSRHERISIISPFNGLWVEGRLDERNLPLSSAFVGVQGTYRIAHESGRKVLALTASRQEYTDEPDFSVTGFAVTGQEALAAGKVASAYLSMVRNDAGDVEQRIGATHYQPLAASVPQKMGNPASVSKTDWITGLEFVTYPERAAYSALVANVALEYRKPLPKGGEVGVRTRLEIDHALDERPGGDRREVELSGQWKGKPLLADWQPSVGASIGYKLDAKPFDPKLYGESTRTQLSKGIKLGLGKKIGNNKLQVSYQYGQTQDKEVPLFDQPAGNSVGISFETNF